MVNFVVDSTFQLTREFAAEHDIKIASLTLRIGSNEYVEGYREDWGPFFSDYSQTKSAATTSQPSPELFEKAIEEFFESDPNGSVIIFTIGDRLSGTINAANVAASKYPDKKIAVVDSHNAGASGYVFLKDMIKYRDGGASFEEVCEHAERVRDNYSMRFIPLTLTELARGGRVNKILSYIGNILNLKPVIEYRANEIKIVGKAIGMQRAMRSAVDNLPENATRLTVMYVHDETYVEKLRELLSAKYVGADIDIEPLCPVGCAHIGLGTVGIVSYYEDDSAKNKRKK